MIDPTLPVFPNNVVEVLALACEAYIDPEPDPMKRVQVFRRPLHPEDPPQCIGITGSLWTPDVQSHEISKVEPTLQTYIVMIQCFVKDMDEKKGLASHSVLSKLVRNMIYRRAELRVALGNLSDITGGATERLQRYGVRSQAYISGEVPAGTFMYLSTLETYFETETT